MAIIDSHLKENLMHAKKGGYDDYGRPILEDFKIIKGLEVSKTIYSVSDTEKTAKAANIFYTKEKVEVGDTLNICKIYQVTYNNLLGVYVCYGE